MKWFLRRSMPSVTRVLLVESGPRADAERLLRLLRDAVGDVPVDLFTCLPDAPAGLGDSSRAWRSYHARTPRQQWRMLRRLRRERHELAAVLCSDTPLLGAWKIALVAALPAKIVLVDEDGEFIWLDRSHWRQALDLAVSRSGIRNPEFARRVGQVLMLPFGLCILLAFAARVHAGRLLRATRADRPAA